ncbi:hypothetical protein [Cognataquiflexum rubidum]|uniref:hypothetical protein n=1 Tax=Cognataquiflexum rubidum TaxID=2922273 RepID=UPI001F1403BB|nr:hypothetical protein [Cognataquiflexum rubidum]MCH6232931.1 hypothetical protein [Cognataquiflexum rubidum]
MLKSTLHIVFSLIFLLNGMAYSVIQANFHMNREEISALFCINQDRPELECNGKCELAKRLDQAQDQEENQQKVAFEGFLLIYSMPVTAFNILPIWKSIDLVFGDLDENQNQLLNIDDFFHPPQG